MLLQRSQYQDCLQKLLSLQHLIPAHRVFGEIDVKHFYQYCIDLSKIPANDFQVFESGNAILIGMKFVKPYNHKIWYGEIAWLNLGDNKKDGITVFTEALQYAKRKGYYGFIYSSLTKDYAYNRSLTFDHSVYGKIFDEKKKI